MLISYGLTHCPIFLWWWGRPHYFASMDIAWFTTDIEQECGGGLLVPLRVSMLEVAREVNHMWVCFSIHAYVSKCLHGTRSGHAWGGTSLQTVAYMLIEQGEFLFFSLFLSFFFSIFCRLSDLTVKPFQINCSQRGNSVIVSMRHQVLWMHSSSFISLYIVCQQTSLLVGCSALKTAGEVCCTTRTRKPQR